MSVQLIDHVKEETVHVKSDQFKSGRFLQVTDDLKLCVRGQVSDSSNVLAFSKFSAKSEDCTDGQCVDCLVSIQFDHHGAHYVVCPHRKEATRETTLQLRVKKVKLEDTLDRKAERVDKMCLIYWFKLKSTGSGTWVCESLAFKDFYISIEGENVLLRKHTHGIPQEENFQIGIYPIAETYHLRVTTEERRVMVNGQTLSIAIIHKDDHVLTSGADIISERGDVQFTDLHVTEIKPDEEYEGKCVLEKSRHDTFNTEQNVSADKSSETMFDSSEMSSATTDASSSVESVCVGAKPSSVADGSSVTRGKSTSSEEASSSIKAINTRGTLLSFTEEHSSGVGKLSASGRDLSSASPPTTPEEAITERIMSSVTEVDIKVNDQDLDRITNSQKSAPSAHVITREVLKDGDGSGELIKESGKISAKKEKKRKRCFALSRIFSCVSSRSAD
ncbi:uncharacterized protein LOC124282229 [Haliotis rubra]|uniref:uncharacterized protein LOC124282229 n=1 Tax=Haliotis rubra TaxID=36100 RepID=UPI001EE5E2B0|nr:uncharacterized protein LOC124282229 [Haliotis rubra]XP_046574141.1 uncharacterized protein LOC124282229 [Haliotis rubra]